MKELTILKKMILIKLINWKSVKSVITNIFAMILNPIQKFVTVVIREWNFATITVNNVR